MLTLRSEHGDFVIQQKLQDALFGGVYLATRFNGDFAVKVVEKSRLRSGVNSCENPDAEIRYGPIFRGHPNLLSPLFFFEDVRAHYIVMPFARGSDMLEMLKRHPEGFDEPTARHIVRQAVSAVDYLHKNQVALQDISLENFLLSVNPVSGFFEVKLCDPGQAVTFAIDPTTQKELPVESHGLVGKAFRPPEVYLNSPYLASKVDSWCLGWSLFYCLTARQLFQSAVPTDEDFRVFQRCNLDEILERKDAALSETAASLIFALVKENPVDRLSISDVLELAEWFKEADTPWSAPMKLIFDERKASPYAPPDGGLSSVERQSTPAPSSPSASVKVSPRVASVSHRSDDHGAMKVSAPVARFAVPRLSKSPTHPALPFANAAPIVTPANRMSVNLPQSSNASFTNSSHARLAFQRALEPFQPPPIVNWRR